MESRPHRPAADYPLRRALAVAALGGLLALSSGHAEEPVPVLPCGTPKVNKQLFQWHVPTTGGPVDQYVMLRGPEPGRWIEHIPLTPRVSSDGVMEALVDGFVDTADWSVAIIAVGPGGESEPSNVITLPAQSRGVCPPGSPTLLQLVDNLIEQSDAHTQGLRTLRARVQKGD